MTEILNFFKKTIARLEISSWRQGKEALTLELIVALHSHVMSKPFNKKYVYILRRIDTS